MPARSNASHDDLQQQPLLRVHRQRPRAARSRRSSASNSRGVVQEATFARVRRAAWSGSGSNSVSRSQPRSVGKPEMPSPPLGDQAPQVLRRCDATGIAAAHADDRDRARRCRHRRGGQPADRCRRDRRRARPARCSARTSGRRVVEDQRRRQPQPGRGAEPVAQLHRGERVEAQLGERAAGFDGVRAGVPEHHRDLGADQFDEQPLLLTRRQGGEPLAEAGGLRSRRRAPGGHADERAQHLREDTVAGVCL